jgi:hypothetical protein
MIKGSAGDDDHGHDLPFSGRLCEIDLDETATSIAHSAMDVDHQWEEGCEETEPLPAVSGNPGNS